MKLHEAMNLYKLHAKPDELAKHDKFEKKFANATSFRWAYIWNYSDFDQDGESFHGTVAHAGESDIPTLIAHIKTNVGRDKRIGFSAIYPDRDTSAANVAVQDFFENRQEKKYVKNRLSTEHFEASADIMFRAVEQMVEKTTVYFQRDQYDDNQGLLLIEAPTPVVEQHIRRGWV